MLSLIARIEELEADNYGPEILNDPQALTAAYFAGAMSEGRKHNAQMDNLAMERDKLKAENEELKCQLTEKHISVFLQMVDKIPIKLQDKLGDYEKKIARLEKEANWLAAAQQWDVPAEDPTRCPEGYEPPQSCHMPTCAQCWREAARKAV